MTFDFLPAIFGAQSFGNIKFQQPIDQILKIIANILSQPFSIVFSISDSILKGRPGNLFGSEGWLEVRKLINEDPDSPKINFLIVALLQKHLRCQIELSTRNGHTFFSLWGFLNQSKISQLYVAILKHKHIFWLQIPVHIVMLMKALKSQNNTGSNESDSRLTQTGKSILLKGVSLDQAVGITAGSVLHHKIQIPRILKCHIERNHELIAHRQNIPLINNICHHVAFYQQLFGDSFHCVLLLQAFLDILFELGEVNHPEGPGTQDSLYQKIIHTDLLVDFNELTQQLEDVLVGEYKPTVFFGPQHFLFSVGLLS